MKGIRPIYTYISAIAACALLFGGTVQRAQGQSYRAPRTFYVQPSIGYANYIGDRDITPLNFDDWRVRDRIPFAGALEVGYQVSTRFAMGGEYRVAEYPTIAPEGDAYARRHTGSLVLRYTPLASSHRLIPYYQAGLHGTVGFTNEQGQGYFGVGPIAGIGADYVVSPNASVFFGLNSRLSVSDRAVDGIGTSEDELGRFDLLNDLSLGVRYRLKASGR